MGNSICPKKESSAKVGHKAISNKSGKNKENQDVSMIVNQSIQKEDPQSKDLSETATQAKFNQKETEAKVASTGNRPFSTLDNPSQKLTLETPATNPTPPIPPFEAKDLRAPIKTTSATAAPDRAHRTPPAPKANTTTPSKLQTNPSESGHSQTPRQQQTQQQTAQTHVSNKADTPVLQLFGLLNEARTNPKLLKEPLTEMTEDLDPRMPLLRSRRQALVEGKIAFDEAGLFVDTQPAVSQLRLDYGLCLAAAQHAQYMSLLNELTHVGPTAQLATARKRAEHYGRFEKFGMQGVGEVVFSGVRGELEALLSVIVDDGMPGRPNREMLFDERAVQVGIGVCPPPSEPGHNKWFYCILIGWPSYVSDPKTYSKTALQAAGIL